MTSKARFHHIGAVACPPPPTPQHWFFHGRDRGAAVCAYPRLDQDYMAARQIGHPEHLSYCCFRDGNDSWHYFAGLAGGLLRIPGECIRRARRLLVWVTCGRRLGKSFVTWMQIWAGTVTCPACWCGADDRWPQCFPQIGSQSKASTRRCIDPRGLFRSVDPLCLHCVL